MSINRTKWTDERVVAVKRFLRTGRDSGVKKFVDRYPAHTFRLSGRKVMVDYPDGTTKELLGDEAVKKLVQKTYTTAKDHVGLTPKTYHKLNNRFANVSYGKVEQAIQATSHWQLYDARRLHKPKAGGIVLGSRVGELLEVDLMYLSGKGKGAMRAGHNHKQVGLVCMTDALSAYTECLSWSKRDMGSITGKVVTLLKKFKEAGVPLKGARLTGDQGAEWIGSRGDLSKSNEFTKAVNRMGVTFVALPVRRPAVHVEARQGVIRRAILSRLSLTKSKQWIRVWRGVVDTLNETPLTDSRAPMTPLDVIKLSKNQQRRVFYKLRDFRLRRNARSKGARQRTLAVGDYVRVALREAVKSTPMKSNRGPQ